MLVLTVNATSAVHGILDRPGLPRTAGVRIRQAGDDPDALVLTRTTQPEAGDMVLDDARGTRVFLGPRAAVTLDDKVLDAKVESGGKVRFIVEPQPQQPVDA